MLDKEMMKLMLRDPKNLPSLLKKSRLNAK